MTEPAKRWILIVAAAWNIFGGASALFAPTQHFAQSYTTALSLDQPLHLFFFCCVWINAIAWGLAYLIAAFVPSARLAVLAAGAAGKVFYALACFALVSSGVGKNVILVAGVADMLLAGLFVAVLVFGRPTATA